MNIVRHLPAGADMMAGILPHLVKKDKDYSSNIIVFPGKRPAHFIRRAIAEREKGAFIPPRVMSMDGFVDLVCEKIPGLAGRILNAADAVALLHEIHLKQERPIGGRGLNDLDSFFSVGLKLFNDLEELCIEDVSAELVKDVEDVIQERIPVKTAAMLESVSRIYRQFYELIEQRGYSSRSSRYRAAARHLSEGMLAQFDTVIFAGFFALTKTEKAIWKKLRDVPGSICIIQEGRGIAERMKELGLEAERPEQSAPFSAPSIKYYKATDTHGQVLALRNVLEEKGSPDARSVIVLPSSETLFPLVNTVLAQIPPESYNISMGYPLRRTPVWGFFHSLMRLVLSMDGERVYLPDYFSFVLHPYTKNIYFGTKKQPMITRILFHTIEEKLMKRGTVYAQIMDIEEDDELLEEAVTRMSSLHAGITAETLRRHLDDIHNATIRRFRAFRNIDDCAAQCTEVLNYIHSKSTAPLHQHFGPFAEVFMEQMELLGDSLLKDLSFSDTAGYFRFLKKYIAAAGIHFPGTPLRGLQVLGALETRGLAFDTVYMLDMNEGTMPLSAKDDSFIPLPARKALGLPTYRDSDAIAAYYFDTLIHGAKEVYLFYVENDRKEKSRFVEQLLWKRQQQECAANASAHVKTIQYKVNLDNREPEAIAKTPEVTGILRNIQYSAKALDTYLACPLKFYYSHVMQLREPESISGDMESRDVGVFVHDVLKTFFEPLTGKALREKDIEPQSLERVFESLFAERFGADCSGRMYLVKRQMKERLKEFLGEYQAKMLRADIIITGVEQKISLNGYAPAHGTSFMLKGFLDRVETRGTGDAKKTYILDYKTSGNHAAYMIKFDNLDPADRATWTKAIGKIQMPFYHLLYSLHTKMPPEDVRCCLLMLGQNKMDTNIERPYIDDEQKATEYFTAAKNIIDSLLNEIINSEIPFAPADDLKTACALCEFRAICGTQWLERAGAV